MRPTIILSVFWVAMIARSTIALADIETIEASISAVDAKGRSITFATKNATRPKLKLALGRKAAVTLDGESATLETLRVGQAARVTYDPALRVATAVEARQFMTVGGFDRIATVVAQADTANARSSAKSPEPMLRQVAQDGLLSTVLYSHPGRMASRIAASGAVGANADWESGRATSWYIEQQRYGADFVQAGLASGDAALAKHGWAILDWGFAREKPDGSFAGTGDPFHSTSMFVEAAARALLLEVQAGSPDAPALVAKYLPRLQASASWLMNPAVSSSGDSRNARYTHRRWLLAAALGEVGQLTGEPAETIAAAAYARQGLALQLANGVNPERDGSDTTYQAYGILMAERYLTTLTNPVLEDRVRSMIVRGLHWEESAISPDGQVSTVGNTRIGVDLSREGNIKTTDYKTIVQAFSAATTLTGDPGFRVVATAVASGRGWIKR